MPLEQGLVLASIGFLASFMSGLLGIGGGLIVVPLLIYVPERLGLPAIDVKVASAIGVALVATSTGSGTVANLRRRLVQRELAVFIVGSMVLGAGLGGWSSQYVESASLLLLFAVLATLGATSMLLPPGRADSSSSVEPFPRPLAVVTGLVVGSIIGLGGAGAFLLLPALVHLLHQPTRTAMATSLAAGFPTALSGLLGKALGGQVPLWPALLVCLPAIPGAQIGTWVGVRLPALWLRRTYALVVLTVALGLWYDILH